MPHARFVTGRRYNTKTLEIACRGKNIAEVLGMTVDAAFEFFADEPHLRRSLDVLRKSAWIICAWANPRQNYPAARPSASSWQPNCNAPPAATRSTSWTSRPPACTPPTSKS